MHWVSWKQSGDLTQLARGMDKNGQQSLREGGPYAKSEKKELTRGPEGSGGHFSTEHSTSNNSKGTKVRNSMAHAGNQRQTGMAGASNMKRE